MADSILKLPGKFEKGKTYLLAGETLLAWQSNLVKDRAVPGNGLRETSTPSGRIISVAWPDGPPVPLNIRSSRPLYMPPDSPAPAEGAYRFWVEWGTLNDQLASNWDSYFDASSTLYFFAKATLPTSGPLKVTSWEIVTGAAEDSHVTSDWVLGDPRPSTACYLLGCVIFTDGAPYIAPSGGGSLLLSEHLTDLEPGTGAGDVKYGKMLTFYRQPY